MSGTMMGPAGRGGGVSAREQGTHSRRLYFRQPHVLCCSVCVQTADCASDIVKKTHVASYSAMHDLNNKTQPVRHCLRRHIGTHTHSPLPAVLKQVAIGKEKLQWLRVEWLRPTVHRWVVCCKHCRQHERQQKRVLLTQHTLTLPDRPVTGLRHTQQAVKVPTCKTAQHSTGGREGGASRAAAHQIRCALNSTGTNCQWHHMGCT